MRLWEIILPTRHNDGRDATPAHEGFRRDLTETFGGYTEARVAGSWRDDDGRVWHDASIAYRVAMEEEPALVALASEAMPDQLAFCFSLIGDCWIVPAAHKRADPREIALATQRTANKTPA